MSKLQNRNIIIFGIVILCLLPIIIMQQSQNKGAYITINVDGKAIEQLELSVDQQYVVRNQYGYNKIIIENHAVYIEESDCKNHICVQTGKISRQGEIITCLPHKLIVSITNKRDEVDSIAY